MIRVLVISASASTAEDLTTCLQQEADVQVVGSALTAEDAVRNAKDLHPDIIVAFIESSTAPGLDATKQVMAYVPTPILVVTETDQPAAFLALEAGALDVISVPAPSTLKPGTPFASDLARQLRMLSRVPVIAHMAGRSRPKDFPSFRKLTDSPAKVIAIACSTGGPKLLAEVLASLPRDFPSAICVVQHLADGFSDALAVWLGKSCRLRIVLATSGDLIEPGTVYLAPNGAHLVVRRGGILGLDPSPPVDGFRPSANVLLQSLARVYGPNAIGVILTGMGSDGAEGIRAIRQAGGVTIAQDEPSSLIFGMPRAAFLTGCVDLVLPAEEIPREILRLVTDPFAWHPSSRGRKA